MSSGHVDRRHVPANLRHIKAPHQVKDNGSVQTLFTCAEPPLHAISTVKASSQACLAKEATIGSHLCMLLASESVETVAPRRFWPRKAGRLQRGSRICVLLDSESIEMVAPKRFCFIFC